MRVKKMNRRLTILAVVLLIPFVSGGLIGFTVGRAGGSHAARPAPTGYDNPPFEEATPVSTEEQNRDSVEQTLFSSRSNAITRTVALASPAVVGINVIEVRQYRQWSPWGDDPFFRQFFGDRTYTQQVQGLGSGFIISPDGYILTNDHVAGNAKEITVTTTSGEKYKAAIVGTDPLSDVCLLKIEGRDFPYLKLGNSDNVIIGEWVIALGNPFGLFDISDKPTVTVGVVSSTGMNLRAEEGRTYRGMIQTDAAINLGNSGGPLLNVLCEVIGVNSVIYTPNQGSIGLGFAIPINRVKGIVAELKRKGKVERQFWIGLEVQSVDARVARYFGLDRAEGVIVSEVLSGSPAQKAGFKVGDIILAINGEKISDESSMMAIMEDARAGDVLKLRVVRDREVSEMKLKLEKQEG